MAMSTSAMEPSEQQFGPRRAQKTDRQSALVRLIRVWDAGGQEVRMATLLNVALVVGVVFSLLVPTFFVVLYGRGLFSFPPSALIAMGSISLVWHGLSMYFNKRGVYRPVAAVYVGFVFIFFTVAILVVGGSRSSLWVLYLWPILVAAIFLPARAMHSFYLCVVLLWFATFLTEQSGVYTPPLMTEAEVQVRFIPLFTLAVFAMCITLLGYAFGYLSSTRTELEGAATALRDYQNSLELQVHERTEEASRFSKQVAVLQGLNRIIVEAADMKDLLRRAVQLLSDAFDAYQVMVFLLDEAGERLVQQMSVRESSSVVQLRVGEEGIVGYAASTGQPYVTSDVRSDPYYKQFPELNASISAAALPIVVQEQTIGVLALESAMRDTFSPQKVEVLGTVANVLGVAILNTRNFEQLRNLLGRLSRYEEQEFVSQWRQVVERRQGRIGLLYDRIQVRAVDASESAELFAGPELQRMESMERPDGTHVLLIPLNVRDRTLGKLMFESDTPWREDERTLVEAVTGQLGLALENARLLEATRRSAALEQTAGELTSRFRQQVEIEAVLQQALADLAQALDAERAAVRLALVDERGV